MNSVQINMFPLKKELLWLLKEACQINSQNLCCSDLLLNCIVAAWFTQPVHVMLLHPKTIVEGCLYLNGNGLLWSEHNWLLWSESVMGYYGACMMGYYGLMVYGSYDQVAIQAAM